MADYDRMIQIFGYEYDHGRESILWWNPRYFSQTGGQQGRMLDDGLEAWKAKKRIFTRDEVLQGQWVKIARFHRI
jgi:hypothetical protein